MLKFLKNFFGIKPTVNPCSEAPYKVEVAKTIKEVEAKVAKKTGKKPAAKKTTTPKTKAKKAE
jgi:hypothetical protein